MNMEMLLLISYTYFLLIMCSYTYSATPRKKQTSKSTVKPPPAIEKVSQVQESISLYDGHVADLTHPINKKRKSFLSSNNYEFYEVKRINNMKGDKSCKAYEYWSTESRFEIYETSGTHLEAPRRLNSKGLTTEELPFDRLILPASVIDISNKAASNSNFKLSVRDVERWESKYGKIQENSLVLVRTDWSNHWEDVRKYYGTNKLQMSQLSWPGIEPETANWLALHRRIYGIGIDTPSVERGESSVLMTLNELYKHNIYTIKNLNNLRSVPTRGAIVQVLPLLVQGSAVSPCRVIATWHKNGGKYGRSVPFLFDSASNICVNSILIIFLFFRLSL